MGSGGALTASWQIFSLILLSGYWTQHAHDAAARTQARPRSARPPTPMRSTVRQNTTVQGTHVVVVVVVLVVVAGVIVARRQFAAAAYR